MQRGPLCGAAGGIGQGSGACGNTQFVRALCCPRPGFHASGRQAGSGNGAPSSCLPPTHPHPPKNTNRKVSLVWLLYSPKSNQCVNTPLPSHPPSTCPPPQTQIDALSAVGLAQDEICNMASISVVSV